MGGEGQPQDAHAVGRRRCSRDSFVALWSLIGDANETYDLTNIGTLFAFALVCIGVMVLRHTDPDRPRPFRVPFVYSCGIAGAVLCVYRDVRAAVARRGSGSAVWLAVGLLLYFVYGYRHSFLRRAAQAAPVAGDD